MSPRPARPFAVRPSRSHRADTPPDWDLVREWSNVHLLSLLQEFAPDAAAKLRGRRCPCPIHGGSNLNFELYDNSDGPGMLWHCHSKCQATGGGIELVVALTNRDRMDVLRELAPRAGVFLDTSDLAPRRGVKSPPVIAPSAPRVELPPAIEWWETECEALRAEGMTLASAAEMHTLMFAALTLGPMGRAYLEGRDFDPEDAHTYGFRSIETESEWDRVADVLAHHYLPAELASARLDTLPRYFTPALLIPYRTLDGRAVIGFNCRALTPTLEAKFDKYRKPKGAKFTLPFNAAALNGLTKADTLHIIEGEFNGYTLHSYGARSISFGSAGMSPAMADHIAAHLLAAGVVVLWFDSDPAGEKGFQKFRAVLARHIQAATNPPRVKRPRIPTANGKKIDVNDLHREGVLASLLEEAPWNH